MKNSQKPVSVLSKVSFFLLKIDPMIFNQNENAGKRIDYYIYVADSTDHTINCLLALKIQIITLAL